MIDVNGLCKDYTIKRKGAGLSGALKALVSSSTDVIHAVMDIIASLSSEKAVKDVSIEEAGIDDIIKIAYGK
jgi:ABC-2 type transport system ATP-binding protein